MDYLSLRGGCRFVTPEAIAFESEVPLAWVLQPKPIEPNEIKPSFHFHIGLWATHLRESHNDHRDDCSKSWTHHKSLCFLGRLLYQYVYILFHAYMIMLKRKKELKGKRLWMERQNDPLIPRNGIREPIAGMFSPGYFRHCLRISFPKLSRPFPFETADFGEYMRQRFVGITISPFYYLFTNWSFFFFFKTKSTTKFDAWNQRFLGGLCICLPF